MRSAGNTTAQEYNKLLEQFPPEARKAVSNLPPPVVMEALANREQKNPQLYDTLVKLAKDPAPFKKPGFFGKLRYTLANRGGAILVNSLASGAIFGGLKYGANQAFGTDVPILGVDATNKAQQKAVSDYLRAKGDSKTFTDIVPSPDVGRESLVTGSVVAALSAVVQTGGAIIGVFTGGAQMENEFEIMAQLHAMMHRPAAPETTSPRAQAHGGGLLTPPAIFSGKRSSQEHAVT